MNTDPVFQQQYRDVLVEVSRLLVEAEVAAAVAAGRDDPWLVTLAHLGRITG